MDVDLRLVRYFLVMAEELHFTAAARRLYVSQPALSNQIRRLEAQLGFQLFDRTSRGVTLTPEGAAFVPHAQKALAAIRAGIADAAATSGRSDVLRIDVLESALAAPQAVLARLRDRFPTMRLEVSSRGSAEQDRRLLAGDLDLGLCGATATQPDGLDQLVIHREPLGVAVPADHPLAKTDAVNVADLAHELHYLPRDDFAPEWNALVVAQCEAAGFSPRRHPASTDGTGPALELVRAGECVALGLLSTPCPDGVVVRPLRDAIPRYEWVVRWRQPGTQRTREAVEALSSGRSGSPLL